MEPIKSLHDSNWNAIWMGIPRAFHLGHGFWKHGHCLFQWIDPNLSCGGEWEEIWTLYVTFNDSTFSCSSCGAMSCLLDHLYPGPPGIIRWNGLSTRTSIIRSCRINSSFTVVGIVTNSISVARSWFREWCPRCSFITINGFFMGSNLIRGLGRRGGWAFWSAPRISRNYEESYYDHSCNNCIEEEEEKESVVILVLLVAFWLCMCFSSFCQLYSLLLIKSHFVVLERRQKEKGEKIYV